MPSATFEEILEEARALPPDEQRQVRELLKGEMGAVLWFLLAAGLINLLEKRNALAPDERRLLREMLNQAALDSGLVKKADLVREVRGKYAHLLIDSQAFALQKQDEIELEDHR